MAGVCLNTYQLENFMKLKLQEVKTILRTRDNDDQGFLIEFDSEYPSSIHEKTKCFFVFTE